VTKKKSPLSRCPFQCRIYALASFFNFFLSAWTDYGETTSSLAGLSCYLTEKKTLSSCTRLVQGEMFRSSVISWASVCTSQPRQSLLRTPATLTYLSHVTFTLPCDKF